MIRKRRPLRQQRKRRSTRTAPLQASAAYPMGFEAGYGAGLRIGQESYGTYFDGTSIIIPSYNQIDYLKGCIESIGEHTGVPYEIIVIDNASADGTAEYLKSVGGQVRYRILETNRGFAGAINIGMMMAKGTTMLLLNNDTVVTYRWLDNMLQCLASDPKIGMVGPVTNYISGDQLIEVPYKNIPEMHAFARQHNLPDSSKWQRIDRLTGFCLLFRRELWEKTGYFDEGFRVGNFEDDDFNIRVRMQGYSLVIARDTFIHHYGSVSMKALGDHFIQVNDHNLQYYMEKWGNPQELVYRAKESIRLQAGGMDTGPLEAGESAFFPQGVAVRGVSEMVYWVEGGIKRPIAGNTALPVVRLSQIDMRRWPIGEPISAEEAAARWNGHVPSANGLTAVGEGGVFYVIEDGVRRRVASAAALERWGLHIKPRSPLSDVQVGMLAEGLPIVAPAMVAERL